MATGTISGPLLNGKISGGLAHPSVYNNQTLEYPDFDLFGTTSEGVAFVVRQTGVGSTKGTVTRIVSCCFSSLLYRDAVTAFFLFLSFSSCSPSVIGFCGGFLTCVSLQELTIGGNYTNLEYGFLLASVNANANLTVITSRAYLVQNILS